jgi:predicted GNAT family N-acyltransferase
MRALEDLAASRCDVGSSVRIELSAQEQALGFYERLGYTIESDRYLDAGIWHRDAWKTVLGSRPGSLV